MPTKLDSETMFDRKSMPSERVSLDEIAQVLGDALVGVVGADRLLGRS